MKKTILLFAIVPFFFVSFGQNTTSTVLTNAKEKLDDQNFIKLSKIIYLSVTKGINGKRITAYDNDLLTKVLSPEEIIKKGSRLESIVVPIDKNDPKSELLDSIISVPFVPEKDINGFMIAQIVTKSSEISKYSAQMVAISPTFKLFVDRKPVSDQSLFWVKFSDLKTIMDEKTFNELVDACIP